jgi:diguanylate cyclase (GGDEF)-like protein/PAS domain S-box-containing protein
MINFIKTYLNSLLKISRQRLSFRLLVWVIICSSFFALAVSIFQLYIDYKRDVSSIHKSLQFIEGSYIKSLTTNAYNMDMQQLNVQLQGILKLQDIEYLEVVERSKDGFFILAQQGIKDTDWDIKREYILEYPSAPEKAAQYSILYVSASMAGVYQRLWDKGLLILLSNLTKTLCASFFIFFIFQYLITRHLVAIAKFSRNINLDNLKTKLVLKRKPIEGSVQDELDLLVDSINNMQMKLVNDVNDRKKITMELTRLTKLFNNVIDASKDFIFVKDTQLRTVLCNIAFAQALGKKPEELYGKTDIENGWSEELVKGNQEKGIRGFETDDLKALSGKTININCEPANINDEIRYFNTIKTPLTDEAGKISGILAIARDITNRIETDKIIAFQAKHDSLTGLVNRREFEVRIERLIASLEKNKAEHALCYMDLDQFKVVNDTCGHAAGDEMLRQLSKVLQDIIRHRDTLARLGGDEFGVLMEHCSLDDANRVAQSLQNAIQEYQFSWDEHSFRLGVSIGLVTITKNTTLTTLLKNADAACYMAKDHGRNRIHVYHEDDAEIAQRHGEVLWVSRINQALVEDRFCLYAQSIEPLDESSEIKYELLIRMVDGGDEIIPPGAFLPAAERYNLISKIDHWVIDTTIKKLSENPAFLEQIKFCSINLSGQSLAELDFQKYIINKIKNLSFSPTKICFEITETAAIQNLSAANLFISKIKVLGCKFALDDFGSGLSSFGYLKNMEVDYLKIDGMFVRDIIDDPIDHAMVKSINEIGQIMGMKTVAEFVENDVIKGMLKEIGVNFAQGYGIGKPMPFEELLGSSSNVTNIDLAINNSG